MSARGLGAGTVDRPSLNGPGRLAVMFVAALAVAVGLSTTNGAFEAAPYALVGTVLAIRRPANSVGWLLWCSPWPSPSRPSMCRPTAAQLAAGRRRRRCSRSPSCQVRPVARSSLCCSSSPSCSPAAGCPRRAGDRSPGSALAVIVALAVLGVFAPTITVNVVGSSSRGDDAQPAGRVPRLARVDRACGWVGITLVLATVGVGSMVDPSAQGSRRRAGAAALARLEHGLHRGRLHHRARRGHASSTMALEAPCGCRPSSPSRCRPWPSASRCCATACTRSTGSSAGPSPMASLTRHPGQLFVAVHPGPPGAHRARSRSNQLAVAGSTLLVFVLFQPLRRRVQRARRPALQPLPLRRRADRRRLRRSPAPRGRPRRDRGRPPGHDPRHTGAGSVCAVAVPCDLRGTPVIERSAGSPGGTRAVRLMRGGWLGAGGGHHGRGHRDRTTRWCHGPRHHPAPGHRRDVGRDDGGHPRRRASRITRSVGSSS